MQEHERGALYLIGIGIAISVGKLLNSKEPLSLRLVLGRVLVGAVMSLPAGAVLLMVPDLNPLATIGLGAAIGILGEQYLEAVVNKWAGISR